MNKLLKAILIAVFATLFVKMVNGQTIQTRDGKEVSNTPIIESKDAPVLTPEEERNLKMKGEKKTAVEKEEILNKEFETKPELKKSEGHFFPASTVWLNTDGPVSANLFEQKVLLVVVSSFDCIECGYYVSQLEKSIESNPAIQLIQVFKGDPNEPVSRKSILQHIQQNRLKHPLGVLPDLTGFRNTKITQAPYFLIYEKSSRPTFAMGGLDGYKKLNTKLDAIKNNKTLLESCYNYRLVPEVTYDKWANPLLENPTTLAVNDENGSVFIYDAAHNRVVNLDGNGNCIRIIGNGRNDFKDDVLEQASFSEISALCMNKDQLYIADTYNQRIRVANLTTGKVSTLFGDGAFQTQAIAPDNKKIQSIGLPSSLAYWNGQLLAASGITNEIFAINTQNGSAIKFAEVKLTASAQSGVFVKSMAANKESLFVLLSNGELVQFDKKGTEILPRKATGLKPSFLTIWKGELIASSTSGNNILIFDNGIWSPIAGSGREGSADGKANEALFNAPCGLGVLNGELIINDRGNNEVRKLSAIKNGNVRTLYYTPSRELVGEAAAHTEGEMVVADTILVGKSNARIQLKLDLGGYKLVPEWSSADMDEHEGAYLPSQQVNDDGIEFVVNGKFEGSDVYLELYLLLEDPKNEGVFIIKRSYLSFYIERTSNAPAAQEQVYKVNILPQ
jgi:hypothetical protein